MFPKIFSLGSFFLPTYGLLVTLGFLAGIALTLKLARRAGLDGEKVMNLAVYCALTGLAGAKLLMFVMDFDYYSRNPGTIFSISTLLSAGVYYGGFLAALVFAWFYMRRQGLPWLAAADVFAPGVALGHAIGRLGCFAAGCCWGALCERPWAVTFTSPEAHELTGVPLNLPLHPAQLYESAAAGLLAWWLYRQSLKSHPAGRILGMYLVLYGVARLALEMFRFHEQALPWGGPLTWTQWMAVGLAVCGAPLWRGLSATHRQPGR
ncbi:MAG: prolipoprotein diacylglyceryl transferase [Candidatus Solibacter usitatus]|nr:prolipoprotein diacylglyceryl transferase [Candidatus Solibacter usitatus]